MNVATSQLPSRFLKGLPEVATATDSGAVRALGLSVPGEDVPLPVMVLSESVVEHNIRLMQDFCNDAGVLLAPHGKTSMSAELFLRQIEAGAWAMTVATVAQARLCRSIGIRRVVIANQVVGAPNLRILAEELNADREFEVFLWIDSAQGVTELVNAHASYGMSRPWQVLLEIGWTGGRTGAQTSADIDRVTTAVAASVSSVNLVGISVFEGLLEFPRLEALSQGLPLPADLTEPFLERVLGVALEFVEAGILPPDFILSGGSSGSFDKVARVFRKAPAPARVVVRPGCYVAHDHGMYLLSSPMNGESGRGRLRSGLELWSYVLSIPEPGVAFLGFGRRDVPYDHGLPIPLGRLRPGSTDRLEIGDATVTDLHDQHAELRFANADLQVGDRVVLGISHPCGAFDSWQVIPVVDDNGTVIDVVNTNF